MSQHHSNHDTSKGSFISVKEDPRPVEKRLAVAAHSSQTSSLGPQKKITLIKQNNIKRVQLQGSTVSYNDVQMEKAGMT